MKRASKAFLKALRKSSSEALHERRKQEGKMIPSDILARLAASNPGGDSRPTAKVHNAGSTATYRKAAKAKQKRRQVSAQAVADFICREEGASMAELEKKFGIKAHPMRAKIYFVRHTLRYRVEARDGRYYGTAPESAR